MERTNGRPKRGLRAVRLSRHLSQEALEESSGVQQRTISKLETGRVSRAVANAIRLARALNSSVEELFGYAVTEGASTPVRVRRRELAATAARSRESVA